MLKNYLKIVALLIVASPLLAQDSPWGLTIANISFSGLNNINQSEVNGITNPFRGQPLTPDVVNTIETALRNTGFFYTIDTQIAPGSQTATHIALLIVVEERPLIDNIRFVGNRRIRTNELVRQSALRRRTPFSVAAVQAGNAALLTHYHENGYFEAAVSFDYTINSNNLVDITFTINEGMPEVVRQITFEGVNQLTAGNNDNRLRQLTRILQQQTPGLFRQRGLFNRAFIPEDMATINLFYRSFGFLDVTVSQPEVVRTINSRAETIDITLVYTINEGRRWNFGGVTLVGNNVFSNEELYPIFNIDPANLPQQTRLNNVSGLNVGEVIDYTRFRQALINLQMLYSNAGYIFNQYNFNEDGFRNEAEGSVSYTITITEFDRAHIENVSINGNTKTRDHVILRDIPFIPGETFSQNKLIQAYNNLMATGYFESVTPTLSFGSEIGLVDINIEVEEGSTLQLNFSISIGGMDGSFPVSGMIGLQETNFLGYGYSLGVNLSGNHREQEVSFNFFNPRVFDSRFGLGFNVFYRHRIQSVAQASTTPSTTGQNIPAPFTGAYVFRRPETVNGVEYRAGDFFPGEPSAEQIRELGLIRDFQFFHNNSELYNMDYHQHEIGFGISTGYRVAMPSFFPGFFRVGTGFDVGWTYITYDAYSFTPAFSSLRDAHRSWVFNDGLWLRLSWDALNNPAMPTRGFILSQHFYLAGGHLGGFRTFLRSQTRFDYHHQFPAIRFGSDENAYSMQWGLRFRTAWNWIGDQFGMEMVDAFNSYFRLDGMFVGRGWADTSPVGRIFWDNSLEFRLPVLGRFIWWDTFLDAHFLWGDTEELRNTGGWHNNFYGAIGTGFRVAIPSFPISFYLIKRFQFEEGGGINWNPGLNPTFPNQGLDIAITFSVDIY
ncbi:MAG: outer membrane protein assembly factor BamA [Spirochaetaceae bacterium]|nr:outer membrane protein assembly factor BamA [Spirochaetaceae bacterium]